jgi:hypothetical protein
MHITVPTLPVSIAYSSIDKGNGYDVIVNLRFLFPVILRKKASYMYEPNMAEES